MYARLGGQMMKPKPHKTNHRFSDTGVQSSNSAMPQPTKLYHLNVHQIVLVRSPPNPVRPQLPRVLCHSLPNCTMLSDHRPPSSAMPQSTKLYHVSVHQVVLCHSLLNCTMSASTNRAGSYSTKYCEATVHQVALCHSLPNCTMSASTKSCLAVVHQTL